MTPMIDIVFLLIIFFMTVTQVSEVNREQLQLPNLKGSTDQKPTTITINVTEDGEIRVAGNTFNIANVVALVENERTRLGDARLLTIVLRVDERGTSAVTNEIVRTLRELGIVRVRIAVEAEQ